MTVALQKAPRSARKAKGDGHLRRAEILQAAERIFVAEGYEGATIRRIADEVGVSSTALYMHFRDKGEILMEICVMAVGGLLALSTDIAARPTDAVTRVRQSLEAYLQFAAENPKTYQLLFGATPREISDIQQAEAMALGERCFDTFEGVVAEVAAAGRLRYGSSVEAAQALWSGCHGLASLIINKQGFKWTPEASLHGVMLDGMLYGLVAD